MAKDYQHTFDVLSGKLSQLTLSRIKGGYKYICTILDEINVLDFQKPVVTNVSKAVLLIHQCCTLILPDDNVLVAKCCKLIQNLVNHQNITLEGQTLVITVRWILQALKNASDNSFLELLATLDTILKSSKKNLDNLLPEIVIKNGPLLQILDSKNTEIILGTLQILETCTGSIDEEKVRQKGSNEYHKEHIICTDVFEKFLTDTKTQNSDDFIFCKILICCLKGLENVIQQNSNYLQQKLGLLLGICKSYMVYYINNVDFVIPQYITPSTFALVESGSSTSRDKKGGKITKQRKQRFSKNKKDMKTTETELEIGGEFHSANSYVPVTSFTDESPKSSFLKLKASDSDFSDTEGGKVAKIKITQGRVRQAALSLLYNVVKLTDKSKIFPFWFSFIPDASLLSKHNLRTCILHEPSPRGRMAALNVLLSFLTTSKMYLSQAEMSHKYSAFTPFSVMLGETVHELHKYLCLALNENSVLVRIQCLKCLSALIQGTPYHRLKPGLLSKVIRNVKILISHKDATVQVASLIVLGCALASEPVVPETKHAFLRQTFKYSTKSKTDKNQKQEKETYSDDDFEYVNFSSDEEPCEKETDLECNKDISWLLQACLNNLGVDGGENQQVVAVPVKLESLQIISCMTRNYFQSLMAPHFSLIIEALKASLNDKNQGTHLHLHTCRTIDFIGQRMTLYFNTKDSDQSLSVEKGLEFWTVLLNGPLIGIVQDDGNPPLRAVACDCLGSIGSHIFERLPRDKQILIITLLFACSRDSENVVKASSVRALGICVQYPSLKEDVGFVVDVAETVCSTLQDSNSAVKIKSAWSLGNLSDSLTATRSEVNSEEIPPYLLIKLLQVTIASSDQNDKVKMNTVRALGNLLQLVHKSLLETGKNVRQCVEEAFNVLVKCSTTGSHAKVRWNACYALGNAMKNESLYFEGAKWQNSVLSALSSLVISYRNFKVRINAGYALSCPLKRTFYGHNFDLVWTSLLKALENAENMEDFSEYKHRDHLVEQICLTIAHLTTLLTPEDLNILEENLALYSELLVQQMRYVADRLVPEKSAILLTALEHLKNLDKGFSSEQKHVLDCLISIFWVDTL